MARIPYAAAVRRRVKSSWGKVVAVFVIWARRQRHLGQWTRSPPRYAHLPIPFLRGGRRRRRRGPAAHLHAGPTPALINLRDALKRRANAGLMLRADRKLRVGRQWVLRDCFDTYVYTPLLVSIWTAVIRFWVTRSSLLKPKG